MKTKRTPFLFLTIVAFTFIMTSCLKDDVVVKDYHYTPDEYQVIQQYFNLPQDLLNYQVKLPGHMLAPGITNPDISDAKATLGRVLFYDPKLSANETKSCASCHHQSLAFSDDVAHSEGFAGELTPRNSLPLGNVANFESSYGGGFSQSAFFFWDERAHSIAQQSIMTIQDEIEMGMDLNELADRLNATDYYPILFKKAYGNDRVVPSRITEALEEFINSIVSKDSRFDEGLARARNSFTNFTNFSSQENLGRALFTQNCASCHSADMSTLAVSVANNGLDMEYEDKGMGALSGNPYENGVFKVPFLRNVELTGPYMHDGRFETLEEVVEHYSSGIQNHPNLDFRLRNGIAPRNMNFTETEKAALVAFLKTLTDPVLVSAEKYSDPFN
jgi:cytochrome c peroxidase